MTQKSAESQSLGVLLLEALTRNEIVLVVDALLSHCSSLDAVLAELPEETRETVRCVLNPIVSTSSEPTISTVSPAKFEQVWSDLWQEWDDVISEAGNEDGKYIEQLEDWESPYFDYSALVDDLEAIAERMQPLLVEASDYGFLDDNDFARTLEDLMGTVVASLPGWIDVAWSDEGFFLERHLTQCLLQWRWLKVQKTGGDGFAFVWSIREWEKRCEELIALDAHVFADFMAALPDSDRQRIYEGLSQNVEVPLWKSVLDNPFLHWHGLYLSTMEQYDPERRLQALRKTIPEVWLNGFPVIEDLLAKEAYRESLEVIEETLQSLLHSIGGDKLQSWTPEVSLLAVISRNHVQRDRNSEVKLLRYYRQVIEALQQSEGVGALTLQLAAYENEADWAAMLAVFETVQVSEKTRVNLWESWRDGILNGIGQRFAIATGHSWWLSWLLDAIQDREMQGFEDFVRQWLAKLEAEEQRENLTRLDFVALRLLTCDLAAIREENWQHYPHFRDVVLASERLKTIDASSRQFFLQQYSPDNLWEKVMAYWQKCLHIWIPAPETARNSDYTKQAQWVVALREVSPEHCGKLLERWRIEHKRRRNLWKALANTANYEK